MENMYEPFSSAAHDNCHGGPGREEREQLQWITVTRANGPWQTGSRVRLPRQGLTTLLMNGPPRPSPRFRPGFSVKVKVINSLNSDVPSLTSVVPDGFRLTGKT